MLWLMKNGNRVTRIRRDATRICPPNEEMWIDVFPGNVVGIYSIADDQNKRDSPVKKSFILVSRELVAQVRAAESGEIEHEIYDKKRAEYVRVGTPVVRAPVKGRVHCRCCGCVIKHNEEALFANVRTYESASTLQAYPIARKWFHAFDCSEPGRVLEANADKDGKYLVINDLEGKPTRISLDDKIVVITENGTGLIKNRERDKFDARNSPALERIIEEVTNDKTKPVGNYNRVYHRHNR